MAIQPNNDREEFLLLLLEEYAERALAAQKLGDDYCDTDDDDLIAEKLGMRERMERADWQVTNVLQRMEDQKKQCHELLSAVKGALLNQAMVANSDARLAGLLADLSVVRELVGKKWAELEPQA